MANSDHTRAIVAELETLLKGFEGCKLVAYLCPAGVWTIGWGETQGVKQGDVWTQEYADSVLRKRIIYFLVNVYTRCPQLWLEPEARVVACGSLAYNIGLGAFGASSVRRYTARQEFEAAARSFLLWNKAGGRVLRGLTIRRRLESRIYMRD